MWPSLKTLHIRQCAVVPLATQLPRVILLLPNLKELHLPNWILMDQDPGFFNKIAESVRRVCGTTRPKIEVSFKPFRIRDNECRILDQVRNSYTAEQTSQLGTRVLKFSI